MKEILPRDQFMLKASHQISEIMSGQKNRIMNIVEEAWAQGKANAETDSIRLLVADALRAALVKDTQSDVTVSCAKMDGGETNGAVAKPENAR